MYSIVTNIGRTKLINSLNNNTSVNIKSFVVGSGEHPSEIPDSSLTSLIHAEYTAAITGNHVVSDDRVEYICYLPKNLEITVINEIGLLDEQGALIAIGTIPSIPKYKGAELYIRFQVQFDNIAAGVTFVDDGSALGTLVNDTLQEKFDLVTGHQHTGLDSPKIEAQNVKFVAVTPLTNATNLRDVMLDVLSLLDTSLSYTSKSPSSFFTSGYTLTYNTEGSVTGLTFTDGKKISVTYNSNGVVTEVNYYDVGDLLLWREQINYDSYGNVVSVGVAKFN